MSTRRSFIKQGALAAAAFGPFHELSRRAHAQTAGTRGVGYGPLEPVRDEATGLFLIKLPKGFRYVSFGWTGDPMENGAPTPGFHDGMAAIQQTGSRVTLIRNHEVNVPAPSIASSDVTFDPRAGGGCTRLEFDVKEGRLLSTSPVLGGTHRNCAGGATPWGTWLSCEETVEGPGDIVDGRPLPFERDHGFIFEVPAERSAEATPLTDMGRFVHEAVAVDRETGIVYETEDQDTAGFYRFLPNAAGALSKGGRLQMMRVAGRTDLRTGVKPKSTFHVSWVDIEEPTRRHSPGRADGLGVYSQGKKQGATTFARLEGCWGGHGRIYFVSTSGGDARLGQVWEYLPRDEQLRLLFESPASHVLDYPDNVTMSPRGGLVLCEDGERRVERLCGLSQEGELFPFAENHVKLVGEKNSFHGDFTQHEWCGSTFSPDGQWLFANLQTPGITVAITGPWDAGPL